MHLPRFLTNQLFLSTPVLIYPPFDPKTTKLFPPSKEYSAIWDTGATGCVISKKVVNDLNLKPIGATKIQTAERTTLSNVYLINLWLPNKVGISFTRVTEGSFGDDADVLIGMDIISSGDLAITNKNRKTTFTFRTPSIETIDFVQSKESAKQIKPLPAVRRNAPCPCGSGKKYKYCHGKN